MQVRCKAGVHTYDDTKHSQCPFCPSSRGKDVKTVTYRKEVPSQDAARDSRDTVDTVQADRPQQAAAPASAPKTVAAWGRKQSTTPQGAPATGDVAPVVGWLVALSGAGEGRDFRIIPGMNTIGRDAGNVIALDFGDNTISGVKHCIIIYDYLNRLFFLQHGEGINLTYLNGVAVTQPTPLNAGDLLRLGNTELKFIPFCTADFCWEM